MALLFVIIGCFFQPATSTLNTSKADIIKSPLPFPACEVTDLTCLRRGIRTFFFLMGKSAMTQVDPLSLTSITLGYPDHGLTFTLRNIKVYGAKWTDILDRQLSDGKSSILFVNNFYVTSTLFIKLPVRREIYKTSLTMDFRGVMSNVSYSWKVLESQNKESYLNIGPETIEIFNTQAPAYLIDPELEYTVVDNALGKRQAILQLFCDEIASVVMQNIIDNFRRFASYIPVRYYYKP